MKSTVEQIRQRFDKDVERFSNLETGQSATMDAPLVLDLIAQCAASTNAGATSLLDIGCGAGNYTLKLLASLPTIREVTLIDLSRPMLDRAVQRIATAYPGVTGKPLQGDVRELPLPDASVDVITAAAVLHHLRSEAEWRDVFTKLHRATRAGGSIWIADLIEHDIPPIQSAMWRRYGEYLTKLKDESYRDKVFDYVQAEDSPRSVMFQIDLLRSVGFKQVDILHKNSVFAAFCAVK
jgi:tRNA (cmo5U34)-methyltransferase